MKENRPGFRSRRFKRFREPKPSQAGEAFQRPSGQCKNCPLFFRFDFSERGFIPGLVHRKKITLFCQQPQEQPQSLLLLPQPQLLPPLLQQSRMRTMMISQEQPPKPLHISERLLSFTVHLMTQRKMCASHSRSQIV